MSLVTVSVVDRVATLTLNNPDARNTLTAPMVDEIVRVVDDAEASDDVGALVVTGAGSAFCAGADLGDLSTVEGPGLRTIYEGFLRVARSTIPTLAAVNGPAVGAGMNLALCCDVRLAARRARFDSRFLTLGIHPGGGHTWMFRRIAGPQATMASVLFGEVIDGAEAERVGLAHRCVDDGELMTAAQAMAAKAAAAPKELSVVIKRTIQDMATVTTHDDAVDRELEPQVWSTRQPFFAERLAALRSKVQGSN
jgi:enoyl-CoA hydratase